MLSRLDRRSIRRDSLIARALGAPGARLVLVQAPAGHGKSTLLEQLRAECERRGDVTAWLDLGDRDNDIRRFQQNLDGLVGCLGSGVADRPETTPRPPARETDSFIERVLADVGALGRPVSLFLDDVHGVRAPQTLALLAQLIRRTPPQVRWCLASRTLPDIGLARLAVQGEALLIRAADLSFTAEETARYFGSLATLELDPEELALIQRQTDGWPAALQLFRLALREPMLRRDLVRFGSYPPEALAAYLAENVLNQQDAEAREFLLLTAAMNRFSAELCDAVLDRRDSATQLAQMEAAGLFLRRSERDPRWFCYHPLFGAFLLDQLARQSPARMIELRRRAAEWFEQHGYREDALEHWVAAGDDAAAAATLERWTDTLIPAAQLMTVEQWSERIAAVEIERRPGLRVKVAWALTFLRRHARLAPHLQALRAQPDVGIAVTPDPRIVLTMAALLEDDLPQAEHLAARVEDAMAEPGSFRAFELGAISNVRGYLALAAGDFPAAHQCFGRTRTLCEGSSASFPWAYSLSISATALIQQGQLHEALALLRHAMADARLRVDESVSQSSIVSSYVVALYEADALDEALALFERFREMILSTVVPDYLASAVVVVSRIHDLRGEADAALALLDEAESIAYTNRWPRIGAVLGWERVRRELVRGECTRARAIAERAVETASGSRVRFCEDVHGCTVARLRLQAFCQAPDEALRLITTALSSARRKGRVHRQIKLLQFAAIAHHRRKSASRSQQYLQEALRLAAGGGYLRAFLEEGRMMDSLLRDNLAATRAMSDAAADSPLAQFLGQLASRVGIELPTPDPDLRSDPAETRAHCDETFTRREQALLQLLADMASTQELADAMHLSRDGLKFHLKNVYAKLGVRTRLEAVRAARQRGL